MEDARLSPSELLSRASFNPPLLDPFPGPLAFQALTLQGLEYHS